MYQIYIQKHQFNLQFESMVHNETVFPEVNTLRVSVFSLSMMCLLQSNWKS